MIGFRLDNLFFAIGLFLCLSQCLGQKPKGQFVVASPWNGNNVNVYFGSKSATRTRGTIQKPPEKKTPEAESSSGSEEAYEASGSEEEVKDNEKSGKKIILPASKVSDPQKILSPWPGMEETMDKPRPVKQRETPKQKNWYTYENKQKGRYFGEDELAPDGAGGAGGSGSGSDGGSKGGKGGKGGKDGGAGGGSTGSGGSGSGAGKQGGKGSDGADGAEGGGSGSSGKGGGSGGGGKIDRNMKNPYNVVRAKPAQVVDPNLYNFFQMQLKPKLGALWISKGKLGGRLDLGSDEGDDIDDLDPSNMYDWQFRRYDRACLYLEYKNKKTNVKIPSVTEELKRLVDNQNEILARRFLEWQFIQQDPPQFIALDYREQEHPHYYTYKFLQGTIEFFMERICKNSTNYVIAAAPTVPPRMAQAAQVGASNSNSTFLSDQRNFLPASFVENIFNLFLVLRNMTMSEHMEDYATQQDDADIFETIMKQCEEEEQPHWYHQSCGDQVLSLDNYNNYACIPFTDYDFNPKLYDPILDSVWLMFNAVHSFCFKQFQANLRMWHKYSMIIANAYTPQMRLRWKASVASEKFYRRLLGPDFEVNLEQISRCTFGTTLRSDVPMLLPRFDTPAVTTFGAAD